MVAPLDIDGRILHEHIQYGVRPVATVEEIADDMQMGDGEPLHERREILDERSARIRLHDAREQALLIRELRRVRLGARAEELDDDRAQALRNHRRQARRRILVAHELREREQARDVLPVPGRRRAPRRRHLLDLLLRIIDERAELRLLLAAQPRAEHIVHLLADDTGAIIQDMEKRRILAVQITHEMLDALRQHELPLQIDEAALHCRPRRILLRQETQHLARRRRTQTRTHNSPSNMSLRHAAADIFVV